MTSAPAKAVAEGERSVSRRSASWQVHVAAALLLGLLFHTLILAFSRFRQPVGLDAHGWIWTLSLVGAAWLCCSLTDRWLSGRLDWAASPVRRLLWQASVSLLLGLAVLGWLFWILKSAESRLLGYEAPTAGHLVAASGLNGLILLTVLSIQLGAIFLVQWRDASLKAERAKRESLQSRFEALRSQVSPHFLFNNLNTLSALIEEDSSLAQGFVHQLAHVYRYVLQTAEQEVVTLEQELSLLEAYTFLLKQRFGTGLQIRSSLGEAAGLGIVPLTLQTLVENAVKHNRVGAGHQLAVEISRPAADLLSVRNPLRPRLAGQRAGTGLKNLTARYRWQIGREPEIRKTKDFFEVLVPLIPLTQRRTRDQGARERHEQNLPCAR